MSAPKHLAGHKSSASLGGQAGERTVETLVPARLDRLPWSRWHMRIVLALGTSWLLDGLQVTLAGSLAGILQNPHSLALTAPQVTGGATAYLGGAVLGALFFGYLTDRLGRRKLFLITLATYSLATLASAFSFNFLTFALFRAITGFGIGGEYAAINSAVDELIPGKVRGTVDLVVNATFWLGAIFGSVISFGLLNGHMLTVNVGWRIAFGTAAVLGFGVLFLRLRVPESPRWLMLRGDEEAAERIVGDIEKSVEASTGKRIAPVTEKPLKLAVRDHTPLGDVWRAMTGSNRMRSVLALVLMVAQSFFFNSVFFTYGLIVKKFYGVTDLRMPLHLLPFALGSFFGPVVLGPLFDRIGRKPMITATYAAAGAMLLLIIYPFVHGSFSVRGLDLSFSLIFFIASSASSAAYLTHSPSRSSTQSARSSAA